MAGWETLFVFVGVPVAMLTPLWIAIHYARRDNRERTGCPEICLCMMTGSLCSRADKWHAEDGKRQRHINARAASARTWRPYTLKRRAARSQ